MRVDLVFSYWIFAWYLLYIVKIVKYSPKFAIGIGILENLLLLCFIILNGSNRRTIFYFVFINTFIKVIPFYTLKRERIQVKDVYAFFALFLGYLIWIIINKQNLAGNYKMVYESLIHNTDEMPFLRLVNYVKTKYNIGFL
jgi:hypothetical protein